MGSRELIDSLWKSAREKAAMIHAEAEGSAKQYEEELIRKTEKLRADHERQVSVVTASRAAALFAETKRLILNERLMAEKKIADRLLDIARDLLPSLRSHDREAVFRSLLREIPDLGWGMVRVHPDDTGLALRHFPGAVITGDTAITGGIHLSTKDMTKEVINTFEKRLERMWDTLLPDMMQEAIRRTVYAEPA